MRGNPARLVRAPVLCLCKRRNRRGLAARMLLVRSGSGRTHDGDVSLARGATLCLHRKKTLGFSRGPACDDAVDAS